MKKINLTPERRRPNLATRLILILPLLLGIGLWSYVEYRKRRPLIVDGVLLAPPVDNAVLITFLAMFTVGYLVFILMVFSEDIKEFFFKHSK